MYFHERLRERRLEQGLTQKQVADLLGVDSTTYAHYESGRRFPNKAHLQSLCEKFGISFEESFPIVRKLQFPENEMRELQEMIGPLQEQVDTWAGEKAELASRGAEEQKREFMHRMLRESAGPLRQLQAVLKPLQDAWEDAMDAPERNLEGLPEHTEVMRVNYDPEEMRLYSAGLQLSLRILELTLS